VPRKCTGCEYTTDDPFQGTCPRCERSLAIVSAGGNRRPNRADPGTDWRTESRRRRTAAGGPVKTRGLPPGGWAVWVVLLTVVGGLIVSATAGGGRREPPVAATPAGRVKIGMTLKDAVLALEPTPSTDGHVSLHDLLSAGPRASGAFTWCDRSPLIRVTFRNGRVTGVSETGNRFADGLRQVDIQLDDDGGEP
jgi:hypothetical protein